MKKINLILSAMTIAFGSLNAHAEDAIIYVDYIVTKNVIEKHFGSFTKRIPNNFYTEYDDENILKIVIQEYNDMLAENKGFVSARGIVNVCYDTMWTILRYDDEAVPVVQYKSDKDPYAIYNEVGKTSSSAVYNSRYEYAINDYASTVCVPFIEDLVKTAPPPQSTTKDCPYVVTMAPDKYHIKYTQKNTNHGFIRHCDDYKGWRYFNPGNLKGSPFQCAKIDGYAVFEDEETGFKAHANLFRLDSRYKNITIRQAIPIYAPKYDKKGKQINDPDKYIRNLINLGVNVDKKASNMSDEELADLGKKMGILEGWNNGIKNCRGSENAEKVEDRKGIEYF